MRKYLIVIVLFTSCIEPYRLEVEKTQRALVIDALISNLEEEQFVRLEYSYSINGAEPDFVTGANVFVIDDLGNSEVFNEASAGLYRPNSSFVGVVGRKYQLVIQTPNGNQYESIEEELLQPASSLDIYGRYLSLRSETSVGFDEGVQFLVDIGGASEENHNYRLQYEEDYEIGVPYESLYEFNGSSSSIDRRAQSIGLCYVNEPSRGLLIATTSGQVNSDLREFPVVFILEDEPELIGRYSLTVRPHRISAATYQYYKDLEENNESAGSFFDRQKGPLIGNIQNINDLSEPVLGYFEVAGISEGYQIFEGGTWKDDGYVPDEILQVCGNLLDTAQTADILFSNFDFRGRLIYNFVPTDAIVPGTFYNTLTVLAPERCSDCRSHGSIEKPAFWN